MIIRLVDPRILSQKFKNHVKTHKNSALKGDSKLVKVIGFEGKLFFRALKTFSMRRTVII